MSLWGSRQTSQTRQDTLALVMVSMGPNAALPQQPAPPSTRHSRMCSSLVTARYHSNFVLVPYLEADAVDDNPAALEVVKAVADLVGMPALDLQHAELVLVLDVVLGDDAQ